MGSLWNRSGTVERYADDLRAVGAKAYFYEGGTTTPLVVYRDSGEASAFSRPVLADANGRWPDVFVPYIVSYDVQVKSADDVQLTFSERIPNPDPVELSVTVDPINTIQTGMVHAELTNSTRTGYVRLNGRTIGNGSSSSVNAERNNADTEDLFTYLWNNLTNTVAPVSGGRGAGPAADFTANKTITLPNCQGAVLMGLDDMGAPAGGFFTGLTFGVGDALTPGSRTGANGAAIALANLPAHSHTGTTAAEGAHTHTGTTVSDGAHTHTVSGTGASDGAHSHTITINDPGHGHGIHVASNLAAMLGTGSASGLSGSNLATPGGAVNLGLTDNNTTGITASSNSTGAHTHSVTGTAASGGAHTHAFTTAAGSLHTHTFTTDSQGSGTPFNNLPRSVLVTWFIKL